MKINITYLGLSLAFVFFSSMGVCMTQLQIPKAFLSWRYHLLFQVCQTGFQPVQFQILSQRAWLISLKSWMVILGFSQVNVSFHLTVIRQMFQSLPFDLQPDSLVKALFLRYLDAFCSWNIFWNILWRVYPGLTLKVRLTDPSARTEPPIYLVPSADSFTPEGVSVTVHLCSRVANEMRALNCVERTETIQNTKALGLLSLAGGALTTMSQD